MNVFGGCWKILIILCVFFLLTSSGCVTQPTENSSESVIITEKTREESTPQYVKEIIITEKTREESTPQYVKENPYWIKIDPIRWNQEGEKLNVSGTTNLPANIEITFYSFIFAHSCPTQVPGGNTPKAIVVDRPLVVYRTFCGGECEDAFVNETVPVIEGIEGINLWRYTLNTSDWCPNEKYWVMVERDDWKNVTPDSQDLHFG